MTQLVKGLEPQPNFPFEDIAADNADILELLLASDLVIDAGHRTAEEMHQLFQLGHSSIDAASKRVGYDADQQNAISTGVATMETIRGLLNGIPKVEMRALHINTTAIGVTMKTPKLQSYANQAYEEFMTELPRTAELVCQANRRRHSYLVTYAVLGAALTYQLERDCT